MEDHSQGRLRIYVHLATLTVTGSPAATCGLDGDLARLQQWPRREDGPRSRTLGGLRRPASAASCPGVRALPAGTAARDLDHRHKTRTKSARRPGAGRGRRGVCRAGGGAGRRRRRRGRRRPAGSWPGSGAPCSASASAAAAATRRSGRCCWSGRPGRLRRGSRCRQRGGGGGGGRAGPVLPGPADAAWVRSW